MTLTPETTELLNAAAAAASDALAEELVAIDVTGRLPFNDAFLIVTADNPRHLRAVRSAIVDDIHQALGRMPVHVEGDEASEWLLINYGDVAVHVFLGEARGYYSLEKLWGQSPRVDVSAVVSAR